MIKLIVAIDSSRGILSFKLQNHLDYYAKKTKTGRILMDEQHYHGCSGGERTQYVAVGDTQPLRDGFEAISDIDSFVTKSASVWVVGGSQLYARLIGQADELYITQVNGLFDGNGEFPAFEKDFTMISKTKIKKENSHLYQFQVWERKKDGWHDEEYSV